MSVIDMQDRELLELAARAAGYDMGDLPCYHGPWNPLEDDGDAFRLAVYLALFNGAQMYHFRALERLASPDGLEIEWTRRAIVRAAAEIGKQMPC